MEQLLHQLRRLEQLLLEEVEKSAPTDLKAPFRAAVEEICRRITAEEEAYFRQPPVLRSDFFRDAVGSAFMRIAEQIGDPTGVSFDRLIGVYDKCIIRVENEPMDLDFRDHIGDALERVSNPRLADAVEYAVAYDLDAGGDRRHGLRARAAAVPQGADPLGDPLSRTRRARDVPGHAHGARHRRPGHQGDPGGSRRAS